MFRVHNTFIPTVTLGVRASIIMRKHTQFPNTGNQEPDFLSPVPSLQNNHSSRNQVLDYGPLGGLEAAGLGLGAYAGLGLGDSSPLHHTLQQYNVTAGMLGLSGIPGQLGLDASNLATLSGFSAGLQSQILSASLLGNQLQVAILSSFASS